MLTYASCGLLNETLPTGEISLNGSSGDNIITPQGLWPEVSGVDNREIYADPQSQAFLDAEVGFKYQWDDYYNCRRFNSVTYTQSYLSLSIGVIWEEEVFTTTISSDNKRIDVTIRGKLYKYKYINGNYLKTLLANVNTSYSIN